MCLRVGSEYHFMQSMGFLVISFFLYLFVYFLGKIQSSKDCIPVSIIWFDSFRTRR